MNKKTNPSIFRKVSILKQIPEYKKHIMRINTNTTKNLQAGATINDFWIIALG